MRIAFTDLSLRKLAHPEKGQARYFDEHLPAFGLTVGKLTKTFIVIHGPNRKLRTIGKYPEVSLADARRAAKRMLAEEPERNGTANLQTIVRTYLDECRKRLRHNTYREYERHLRKAPNIKLRSIKKTSVKLDEPHAINAWKVFANWCIKNELLEKNPFLHIPVVYGKRARVLADEEIRTIMQYEDGRFSNFLKLCILTGQRKTEVATIRQAWLKGDTLTIPSVVAKNGREHSIAFNLLTARYLPREDLPPFQGFSRSKARFDKAHPFPHWTIHDLRRTFATVHARLGTPIHVVEAMLNHTSGTVSGVAAIYIRHNFLAEIRKAAANYELFIARLCNF